MIEISRKDQDVLKKLYQKDILEFLGNLKTMFRSFPITHSKINQTLELYNILLKEKTEVNEFNYDLQVEELFEHLNIVQHNDSEYGILFLPPYKVVEKESTPTSLCPTKVYWYLVYDETNKRLCTFELRKKHTNKEVLIKYELNYENPDLPF